MRRGTLTVVFACCAAASLAAQVIGPSGAITPNLATNIERPLRYRPDGHDFVIENGGEFFNRPLYGRNTAFRVDAGDIPEFLLYLPGRGGNLRLGLHTAAGTKWLHEAGAIVARYRPGEMLYEIRDPLLGSDGVLLLEAVPMHDDDGLIVRLEARQVSAGTTVVFGFGGVSGQRGRRDGDIGTEAVPIAEYFQLRPEVCRDDRAEVFTDRFIVRGKSAEILGLAPAGTTLGVGSSHAWARPFSLLESQRDDAEDPVVVGEFALQDGTPAYLALQRLAAGASQPGELPVYREVNAPSAEGILPAGPIPRGPLRADEVEAAFLASRDHYVRIRGQIRVETPDPFIDAAVAALNIAADAVWDEPQQGIMHGAIAWRTRLLGWRGPCAMDALGWHERARAHFRFWASRQNTDPIPEAFPPPEEETHLARSRRALHSNGNMAMSHYDMNLVAIDALLRHLRWTGDLEFAREMWPVIERHLAWEQRLFRREYTTAAGERLPLYEAYAAIWASDDLQYSGGGTAHASAYNFFHHTEAARLARLLGRDAAPFEREADLIARGMRELLWLPEEGTFAECKDLLGLQLVHPSAALWSVYHVIDSEVARPYEARAMTEYVDAALPWLPIRGPGVPTDGAYGVFATSTWMPYTWSINNVVLGENVHAALAYWQAGRPADAFVLTKSALLASMYMGICPGNVGSMNTLDVYRRESQRDFADGSGVLARAVVEGLFGVRPDALTGELLIQPGFPADWDHASLDTPDLTVRFTRSGDTEMLLVKTKGPLALQPRVVLPAHGRTQVEERIGVLEVAAGEEHRVTWRGELRPAAPVSRSLPADRSAPGGQPTWLGTLDPVGMTSAFNDRVTEIFRPGKYRSPRSPYVSLALPAQGIGAWAGHVNATAEIDDSGLRAAAAAQGGAFALPSGVVFSTPGPGDAPNVAFVSQWDNYPREASIPLAGRARRVHLLMAGSTNAMQSRLDNGEVIVTYADGGTARLALRNPQTWWPIEQDYFIDDFQFRIDAPLPTRVDLRTGAVRVLEHATFKGRGGVVPGGAATVLALDLDAGRELKSLTVRALANDVVIGLMAATLER